MPDPRLKNPAVGSRHLISTLLIAMSGEIRETRSGHLGIYKSSCVVQTPVPRRADTKNQAQSNTGSELLSTIDIL